MRANTCICSHLFFNNMKLYICAIIKDEQLYLDEWIQYHLSLGIDEIYLCEDLYSTSHADIVDKYDNVFLYKFSDFPNYKNIERLQRQIYVYNCFIENYKDGWCAFIDIDEYIHLENGYTLQSIINEYSDSNGLNIWWKFYGCNGYIQRPNKSIREAYFDDELTEYDEKWSFKSFVNLTKNTNKFKNCHFVPDLINIDRTISNFSQTKNKKHKSFDKIWLEHYISKSWEDWQLRIKRGSLTAGFRKIQLFFELNPNMKNKITTI